MKLKWEHKVYEKDFTTKEIYINEINKILDKLNEDYEVVKRKVENTDLHDMNSEIVTKVLDYSEEIVDEYRVLINEIEDLKGEIR